MNGDGEKPVEVLDPFLAGRWRLRYSLASAYLNKGQ